MCVCVSARSVGTCGHPHRTTYPPLEEFCDRLWADAALHQKVEDLKKSLVEAEKAGKFRLDTLPTPSECPSVLNRWHDPSHGRARTYAMCAHAFAGQCIMCMHLRMLLRACGHAWVRACLHDSYMQHACGRANGGRGRPLRACARACVHMNVVPAGAFWPGA